MRTIEKNEFTLFDDGANWVKADFHLHSPFVDSFTLPPGINLNSSNDIERLIDQYLNKLKEKEIKICAITDYQQIRTEWFQGFQQKASENGIYIFPGIELSINYGEGLHILLIFEYEQDITGINDYIKALDKKPQNPLINDRKHRDIDLKEDLTSVLQTLKKNFSCLIIFPHTEDDNGLLKFGQPKEASRLLKMADAIEFISDQGKNKLVSTAEIQNDFFTSHIAIIESTDPKSLDDIGSKKRDGKTRCTYLKLSSVSLNAIRIAFQDPSLRVRLYEEQKEIVDKIESIEISGATFLKNIKLNFNNNLNCLIGGRGVGKSAIIESIRYCLDLPYYAEESFKNEFIQNVVGSGGKITIRLLKKYGDKTIPYTINRVIGQQPIVEGKNIPPVELFEEEIPILLGQKELYVLSNNQNFQMKLVDQLIGDEIKKKKIEFNKKLILLKENSEKLLKLHNTLLQKENDEQKLRTLNEHIKTFEKLGVAEKLGVLARLTKDNNILNNAISKFKSGKDNLIKQYQDFIQEVDNTQNNLRKGESAEKQLLAEAENILNEYKKYLKNQFKNLSNNSSEIEKQLNNVLTQWNNRFEKNRKESDEIKRELSLRGLSPDKYEALIQDKVRLEPLIKEYETIERQKQELESERKSLKNDIQKERHNLFTLRKERIEKINEKLSGRVKLEVSYQSDRKEFKDNLASLLSGLRISEDTIAKIVDNKQITIDGIELSKVIQAGDEKLQKYFQLTDAMTRRITDWFKDRSKLYQLENLFPEDLITIKLKVGEGEEYRPFDKLSDGQKATALLVLLFSQERKILIIDQPEEDLDNRFVYDDIVVMLRQMKGKRQLIFATHNANIPVLGDSEQVFVLDAEADQCKIKDFGSIDKTSITENIKKIMEGGEEAFRKRIQKYGVKI